MATNLLNSGRKSEHVYFINGKRFDSLSDAAATNAVHKSTIIRWCNSDKKPDCYRKQVEDALMTMAEVEKEAKHENKTPLEFMLDVMNDESRDVKLRAQMANWAAPYVHARKGEGAGKKETQAERAQKAGAGRFGAGRPPLSLIK